MKLSEKIINEIADRNELLLWYLGQAGFLLKTAGGKIIAIDLYLSDAAERLFGFRRMTPAVIQPEDLKVDYYLSTHSHIDHLDVDILADVARNGKTFFIGSPDCEAIYRQNGIESDRYCILKTGYCYKTADLSVRAVYADHGSLAPDAMGLLVETGGIKVLHTGDTAYKPEKIAASLQTDIDVLIAPINAQFGNMNAHEACQLAENLLGLKNPAGFFHQNLPGLKDPAGFKNPNQKILIACHFWMFLEHMGEGGCGDPTTFLREAAHLPKTITPLVMAPGEMLKYQKNKKDE